MIKQIFDMLNLCEHYGQSELIEIAKGKYELPLSLKEKRQQVKREKEWQRLKKQ